MSAGPARAQVIQELTQKLRQMEQARRPAVETAGRISTGVEPLDALLPGGGWQLGTIVEWLAAGDGKGSSGGGAGTLALAASRPALNDGGAMVVVDPSREFYPPAAAGLGIALERMLVVNPADEREALWAIEQSLRCTGVAATVGWIGRLDSRAFRRLQLAAEAGGGLGIFLRPERVRKQPSWAEVRLLVSGRGSRDKGQGPEKNLKASGGCQAPENFSFQRSRAAREKLLLPSPNGRGAGGEGCEPSRVRYPQRDTGASRPPLALKSVAADSQKVEENSRGVYTPRSPFSALALPSPPSTLHLPGPPPSALSPPPFPQGRLLRIELLHCRVGPSGGAVDVVLSDETGLVHLAPRLAPAEPARRATG